MTRARGAVEIGVEKKEFYTEDAESAEDTEKRELAGVSGEGACGTPARTRI
jgi:hypothetical protein